jgi:hypothetical protein
MIFLHVLSPKSLQVNTIISEVPAALFLMTESDVDEDITPSSKQTKIVLKSCKNECLKRMNLNSK